MENTYAHRKQKAVVRLLRDGKPVPNADIRLDGYNGSHRRGGHCKSGWLPGGIYRLCGRPGDSLHPWHRAGDCSEALRKKIPA